MVTCREKDAEIGVSRKEDAILVGCEVENCDIRRLMKTSVTDVSRVVAR